MVFKGYMIVVPATLQQTILRHLLEGYMGLEKMRLRAYSAVFWLGLTADVNNMAENCETCQKHAHKQGQEQILVHEPTKNKTLV